MIIAEEQIDKVMRNDCHPVILSVLVANDKKTDPMSCTSTDPKAESSSLTREPPLDAEKSRKILQSNLESFGIVVIPVVNCSKEYLDAILESLAQRQIPQSCELFWCIFTGHGHNSCFCVNGKDVPFDDLIQSASRINIRYMAFLFECCQSNSQKVTASDIQKEHIVIYSAPPGKLSYHYEGVGLLTTCLADLLSGNYKGSLNQLQLKLRQKYRDKIVEVFELQPESVDNFVNRHLSIHISNMLEDLNLYSMICDASKLVYWYVVYNS